MNYSVIVGISASLLGLVFLGLSYQVVNLRRTEKIGLGAGGNDKLLLAVRAQANFSEYVPISLILIFMLMRSAGDAKIAAGLTLVLLIARIMHGFGLSGSAGYSFGRFYGTLFTWIVLAVTCLLNIYFLLT
jgi:uncharacterized membrane protein YecN with MAPEG domain